jgi:hypothetical protein
MISFNLGIPSNSFEDVKKLAVETERLVSRLSTYKIEKQPAEAKISSSRAIFMVNRITIAEVEQKQFIYYFLRTGYVLGVTITCVDDADCVIANKSLDSFQFDEK